MDTMSLLAAGAALGGSLAAIGAGAAAARGLWRWASNEDGKMRHNERLQHISLAAQVEVARAAQPLPPQHYSPHIVYSPHFAGRAVAGDAPAAALGSDERAAQPTPTFADLLQQGRIGQGQPLLLGFAGSEGIWGGWGDLYSSAIGGLSGSGKSWAACNLLAQSVLNGARLLLIDPDASNSESLAARLSPLASRFVCDPAEDDSDIQTVISLAAREIERRRAAKDERHSPLVIAIDEYAALQRGSAGEALAGLVEDIARRGRRLGVYAMCLSQVWQASRSGGGHTRDAFASALVMRMRSKQASMLTGLPARDLPADILELPAGQGYLLTTKGELQRIAQPLTTPGDMQQVAALLPDNLHSQAETLETGGPAGGNGAALGSETGSGYEAARKPGATPAASQKPLSAQEAQILALAMEATPVSKIVEAVYGVKGGNRYAQRSQEVMQVIAAHLQQEAREVGA
jgi:hypothetical protein